MHFGDLPFTTTDWDTVPPTEHEGDTGVARWRTIQAGDIRVRMVEYSAGYAADHWCSRGHVLLVLEGELVSELQDGRTTTLRAGMSYQVGNDREPHRSTSQCGARLFIVD